MKKWRPNPREKMAFLEIGLPKVDSLISVEPSPKFHNLWVARQKKAWRRRKMVSTQGLFMFLMYLE